MLPFESELNADASSTMHFTEHNPDDGESSGGANPETGNPDTGKSDTGNLESLQHQKWKRVPPTDELTPNKKPSSDTALLPIDTATCSTTPATKTAITAAASAKETIEPVP